MLTRLTVRNFKRFRDAEIDLGSTVVFIGPNNSGKTTALQALALWDIGLKRWLERRGEEGATTPKKRPGITINRRDLISVPVPDANLLWRNLHVRDVLRENGKPKTSNVRIEVLVEGVTQSEIWSFGLEFDYANAESFYCRPIADAAGNRMPVPAGAKNLTISFLPPMSGLADREFQMQPGQLAFLIGQGRTAEVLRNLCFQVCYAEGARALWRRLCDTMHRLFGVELDEPIFHKETASITMTYKDASGAQLDLSSSGRGLQQTLLLLAYMEVNPGAILLLDEPDAHLEILRQRQIYDILTKAAADRGSQIIAASHSEVILNEAANRDVVVAFVGRPHRIDDRGNQLSKSLTRIGFDQYYEAEHKGWVLYLEGSTDLETLATFARTLGHSAIDVLERPFVSYFENQPSKARDHFHGLREAKPDLVGILVCDRIDKELHSGPELVEYKWQRNEIENYLCQPETLMRWAKESALEASFGPLFEEAETNSRTNLMRECIEQFVPRAAQEDPADQWWINVKASDDFLDRVFQRFFEKLNLPNLMRKANYHVLARHTAAKQIDPEITLVLDRILDVSKRAAPLQADEP